MHSNIKQKQPFRAILNEAAKIISRWVCFLANKTNGIKVKMNGKFMHTKKRWPEMNNAQNYHENFIYDFRFWRFCKRKTQERMQTQFATIAVKWNVTFGFQNEFRRYIFKWEKKKKSNGCKQIYSILLDEIYTTTATITTDKL